MNHALIVVDLQNDFLVKGGYYDRKQKIRSAIPTGVDRDELSQPSKPQPYELRNQELGSVIDNVSKAIVRARRLGWPIAFVFAEYGHSFESKPGFLRRSRTLRDDYPCKPGTWGAQPIEPMLALLYPGRQNTEAEIVVHKHTLDGFVDTELMHFLRTRGIGSVCVGGVETDACVLATAISASSRFESIMLDDCTWTSTGNGGNALRIFANAFGLVKSWSTAISEGNGTL